MEMFCREYPLIEFSTEIHPSFIIQHSKFGCSMLHRLALRVLPQLSLTVTEPAVRSRKRIVMFVAGLVIFAAYRALKLVVPLSEAVPLLVTSGSLAVVTAGVCYAAGRQVPWSDLFHAERPSRWVWLLGWTGFVYAIQLSLLVLALLQVAVDYDFLTHPEGPAMMAIIIPNTAVTRDAFEIGYLRRMESQGRSFLTFPNGTSLRGMLRQRPTVLLGWTAAGVGTAGLLALAVASTTSEDLSPLVHLLMATLVAGSISLTAYLAGLNESSNWLAQWRRTGWLELAKFWWWPGLAFSATYFLAVYGLLVFALQWSVRSDWQFATVAGCVGGLMGLYSYYLGARRSFETRLQGTIPAAVLRCPFVTGLLSKQMGMGDGVVSPPQALPIPETHQTVPAVTMEQVR